MSQRPLTVIQVIPKLISGGAERGTVEVSAALVSAGHRSIVVTSGGRMARDIVQHGGEVVQLPVAQKSPWMMWRNARALQRLINDTSASLIHARSRGPAWSAYRAARACDVPLVTTYHGLYQGKTPLKRWYNGIMVRGQAVIAVSQFIGQHICETYPQAASKVCVIPRGVDLTHFLDVPVSQLRLEALLRTWGLHDDARLIVLMPGRISATKGHDVLIDALHILRQRRTDFVCVCVGDNDGKKRYARALHEKISQYGLQGHVRFVDHTADMPAAYALSHVVVVPSTRAEAFGRVPVESQAMQRPVVAAAHGGACETIVHGVTGFLVTPHSAAALAEGMDAALSMDSAARAQMAQEGRANVMRMYRTDRMCTHTLHVYQNVVQSYRNGAPFVGSALEASLEATPVEEAPWARLTVPLHA